MDKSTSASWVSELRDRSTPRRLALLLRRRLMTDAPPPASTTEGSRRGLRHDDHVRQPPPHPAGWYVVAFSSELASGAVLTRAFFGGEVVVYRTYGGTAVVAHAYCPHLGAHLGQAGRIDGEALRCGFHGFRFDVQGACVGAYPGRKAPVKCRLPVYESRERNGHILVYFHPEHSPSTWEVPALDDSQFRPQLTRTWNLRGHPQEVTENSVDIGHFAVLHGYTRVDAIQAVTPNGPLLHGHYTMHRARSGLSRPITTDFEVWVWGLGYSVVEAHIREYDLLADVRPAHAGAGRTHRSAHLAPATARAPRRVHPLAHRAAGPARCRPHRSRCEPTRTTSSRTSPSGSTRRTSISQHSPPETDPSACTASGRASSIRPERRRRRSGSRSRSHSWIWARQLRDPQLTRPDDLSRRIWGARAMLLTAGGRRGGRW